MSVNGRATLVGRSATLLVGLSLLFLASPLEAEQPEATGSMGQAAPAGVCQASVLGSPFIPVDSWVYPAVLRLYSLGYVDDLFLGVRPWKRSSVARLLDEAGARIESSKDGPAKDEAGDIYKSVMDELQRDMEGPCLAHRGMARIESVYSVARAISGTPLRDSFHLGSTLVNDYGRPYANGFNNYSGISGYASAGRFVLYARTEFQGDPSTIGYSAALAQKLSKIDGTTYMNPATGLPYNQATIPGQMGAQTDMRVMEAYASVHFLRHEISFGKEDEWLGSAQGASMAYSNNAENIYAFHINQADPLRVPGLSRITGPFRYEFLVGSLKGHIFPNDPWTHLEKINLKPTRDLELGFERTVIWGGEGHEPITIKSFLRSFFSTSAPGFNVKHSRTDPGARFATFDFSYRLPFVRNWLTLYSDSMVHDDVSPIDAPRRASWRPGLYLSHVPGIPKLDLRIEGVSTDPPVKTSNGGRFMYWEVIQIQGYTNKGVIFGDWNGREAKGGQGWLTYHLSGNESIQASFRSQKAEKDFIPGGTTLNDIDFQVVKRIGKDFEINGSFALEHWKAPIYMPGPQTVTTTNIQLTWYPKKKTSF